jgi:hypothetical protein
MPTRRPNREDTGGAASQLRWSDLTPTQDGRTVRWRAELAKVGHAHETPFSEEASALLGRLRSAPAVIGDTPVFPTPRAPSECLTRHAVRTMWDTIAKSAGVPAGQRYG